MAMTPAETLQVEKVSSAAFDPAKGAVEPKGLDPGPISEGHEDAESSAPTWKEVAVSRSPSGNVSSQRHSLVPQIPAQESEPEPNTAPLAGSDTPKPPPAESPPAEAPKPSSPNIDARRFAALAREGRKNAQERSELSRMREELASGLAELQRFNEIRSKAKFDPLTAVREAFGLDYEDLTKAALNNNTAAPETQLRGVREELDAIRAGTTSEVANLRKELENRDKQANQNRLARLKQQEQETIGNFLAEVRNEVASGSEKYPYLNFFGAADNVANFVYDNFKRTGKLMQTEEALKYAEGEYQKYYAEKSPGKPRETKPAAPGVGAKSLSNAMTVSNRGQQVNGKKSDDQRLKEAIAALQTSKV